MSSLPACENYVSQSVEWDQGVGSQGWVGVGVRPAQCKMRQLACSMDQGRGGFAFMHERSLPQAKILHEKDTFIYIKYCTYYINIVYIFLGFNTFTEFSRFYKNVQYIQSCYFSPLQVSMTGNSRLWRIVCVAAVLLFYLVLIFNRSEKIYYLFHFNSTWSKFKRKVRMLQICRLYNAEGEVVFTSHYKAERVASDGLFMNSWSLKRNCVPKCPLFLFKTIWNVVSLFKSEEF